MHAACRQIICSALLALSSGYTLALDTPVTPVDSQHFDVAVNHMPAKDFFLALMEGTKENIVLSDDVSGDITLRLNHVTLQQTLNALADAYGYQYMHTDYGYQILGTSQNVRIYHLSYLASRRYGQSQTFVAGRGGSTADTQQQGTGGSGSAAPPMMPAGISPTTNGAPGANPSSSNFMQPSNNVDKVSDTSSIIKTFNDVNFWEDLKSMLSSIAGKGGKVIVQPESGLVVVTAPPETQSLIASFLQQTQDAMNAQVLIEAKIVEVQLNSGAQEGINWQQLSNFASGKSTTLGVGSQSSPGVPTSPLSNPDQIGGVFGFAASTGNFNGILQLLQTQGDVNVLSSPRIATVNNQKALIKVGTDQYFATALSFTTLMTGINTSVIIPNLTLDQFFSGIALDILPEIHGDEVTLHVKPSVTQVTQQNQNFNLGTTLGGDFTLPLAFSQMREADTVVRGRSGQIIVIGGLMTTNHNKILATTPLLGEIPILKYLFQQKNQVDQKTELVFLLRPLVVPALSVSDYLREDGERLHLNQQDFAVPGQHP